MTPTLTVDIGTTRIKVGLFDAAGDMRAVRKWPTPVMGDDEGSSYDIEALIDRVIEFVTRALDDGDRLSVRKIAITGVGESGGLVGPDLRLHSPMILWHDHRGQRYLDALSDGDRARVYRVTGLPVNAHYALSKVAWAVAQAGHDAAGSQWLNVSEFLAAHMTGRRWAEYSLASRTMALDLGSQRWSDDMCALVGIDARVFPELRAAYDGEPLRPAFARAVGLDPSVEVHVVGHDHMVGGVGAGLSGGEMLNSTGTTEGLLGLRNAPYLDRQAVTAKLANGVRCDGPGFTLFVSIPTGGSAFQTLQGMLGLSAPALTDCLARLDERYLAGELDLSSVPVVVPHFRGSPPPEKSSRARGVMANLSTDVTADDIVFGCFLGLAVQFRTVLGLFPQAPTSLKVIGPATANALWLHLKADLLGLNLGVSRFDEVVSKGAQALASGVAGDWPSCQPHDVEADPSRHARLQAWYDHAQPTLERLAGAS